MFILCLASTKLYIYDTKYKIRTQKNARLCKNTQEIQNAYIYHMIGICICICFLFWYINVPASHCVLQHGYPPLTSFRHRIVRASVTFNLHFYKSVCCTSEALYGVLFEVGCAFCV